MNKINHVEVVSSVIERSIHVLRGKNVMLDADLAALYGVETRILNQAVKRNIERFPPDFMFILTTQEENYMRSQFVISHNARTSIVKAFTEQGIAMLSSVLRSERAVQVNIQIIRTFTKLRELFLTHTDLKEKIEALEQKYDGQFKIVFDAIHALIAETAKGEPSS